MGKVRIDTTKRMHQYEQAFNLATPEGVRNLLQRWYEVKELRAMGDIDAATILMDFLRLWEQTNLTYRERDVLQHLYLKLLTRKETAEELGISVQAVKKHEEKACRKLAAVMRGQNNGQSEI